MTKLDELKRHLKPGDVYRREDLARWSNAVDRHLKQLDTLVEAFLKDRRFLLASPNAYNSLGVGTTQLYDQTVVYNHKRHGDFQLGGRKFAFRVKPHFPKSLSREFLLVDLVNNLDALAEAKSEVLGRVKERATAFDGPRLRRAVRNYGSVRTRKFFDQLLSAPKLTHAA